jgi:hypothetical protein
VEELACRFNIQQLELLMTCTNTLVITGDLLAQIRTLSLYDGGLLGVVLERCPTTAIILCIHTALTACPAYTGVPLPP